MSVNEGKAKFFEAKKAVEDCKRLISELQKKSDTLEESLPGVTRAIEDTEKAKTAALDNFAMTSNKQTESALKAARVGYEDAQKKLSEINELIEACNRSLKKQESELIKLNNACDLARRGCWHVIAGEIKAGIPAHIFDAVRTLLVAGAQCCMTRQFILDSLFPNIPTGDFQTIRSELCEKYKIE